jgi:hypothetical protein
MAQETGSLKTWYLKYNKKVKERILWRQKVVSNGWQWNKLENTLQLG